MESVLSGRSGEFVEFWTARRLCMLSTVRKNGTVHVVMVGATVDWDAGIVRVICSGGSHKARQIRDAGAAGAAVAVSQTEAGKWSTLEGRAVVSADPERVAEGVRRYTERYRAPRVNPERVVLEITVTKVFGNA
ncbi:pyridoxamine 5'-phosphate oxidase family protein [Kribbella amoyensis]|uniref:pyridoxamine 5'-phosphate oxidase family protein n=1 Tax=Kribbella amoyensis TaxID=996641 RepID=UPI0011A51849|nr:pyridoxamine 5'-phosphate oxidase family protein [Kribbella amoyensis]